MPTILDQINAEKTKISERLARLNADREKIATQLTDLETAERVLTRVSTTPSTGRPRDRLRLQKQKRQLPTRVAGGRQEPPPAGQQDVKPGRESSAWASVFSPWRPAKPDKNYTQHVPTIARTMWHGGTAPYPRGADPRARGQTLCDFDCSAAGTSASVTPVIKNHKGGSRAFSKRVQPVRCRPKSAILKRRKRRRTPPHEKTISSPALRFSAASPPQGDTATATDRRSRWGVSKLSVNQC
jgi:hypothetical protein